MGIWRWNRRSTWNRWISVCLSRAQAWFLNLCCTQWKSTSEESSLSSAASAAGFTSSSSDELWRGGGPSPDDDELPPSPNSLKITLDSGGVVKALNDSLESTEPTEQESARPRSKGSETACKSGSDQDRFRWLYLPMYGKYLSSNTTSPGGHLERLMTNYVLEPRKHQKHRW